MRLFLALACLTLCAPSATRAAAQDTPSPRHDLRVAPDSALELHALWEPYRTSKFGLFEKTPALRTPAPARERETFAGAAFGAFLPRQPVALGEVWKVESGAVLAFLRQFHAGAALNGMDRGDAPGTYACLRALSDDACEILVRAHAVFELGNGLIYKPGQFEGRLVLERASGALRSFHLALPSRDPNAALFRRGTAKAPTRADLGWVPRMELSSGERPSLAWSHEVPDEEARLALLRSFYTFQSVDWLPLEQAVPRARESQKPLHLVVLFGALDDDSC